MNQGDETFIASVGKDGRCKCKNTRMRMRINTSTRTRVNWLMYGRTFPIPGLAITT
jgi:hypothetical protein